MTRGEVLEEARRLVRQELRPDLVEDIVVREDEDWTGDPSLFIDVFLAPTAQPFDAAAMTTIRRNISEELLAGGERRFAYLRFRDRAGEEEDYSGPRGQ